MRIDQNLSPALDELMRADPRAMENVVYEVRKTIPDVSFAWLTNLLRGQQARDSHIGPLADALKIHRRQLIAQTPQARVIADDAVRRYGDLESGDKVERFCAYAESSADFRHGAAELDLDEIALTFEAYDKLSVQNLADPSPSNDDEPQ